MKRLIMITFAVVLAAFASTASAERITGGIKAGANFGDFAGDDKPENLSTRTAFQGGGFIQCPINQRLGVRGEVLYVQKGAEGDFLTDDGDIHTALYKLDYIDIPVLFVANFPAGDSKFGFNVFAGPSFNFNVSAKAAVEEHGTLDQDVKSFEFGAAVGAGATYAFETCSLLADVRYSMGVTSASDHTGDTTNSGVGVMGGIAFPIGSER